MPLIRQCSELSIEYSTINLNYESKPEKALLAHYEALGYIGTYYEGTTILTILKALLLDKLAEYNSLDDRNSACTGYLESQLKMLKSKISEITPSILTIKKDKFLANFREIISKEFISLEYPDLSESFAAAMYDAINLDVYMSIANKISENPYGYRCGWPDLTIVKGEDVRFIEVKTSDKLHDSQIYTIPAMMEITPFSFSVCRLVKS